MTKTEIYAWILISIPESGGSLQDVISKADSINRAIPTQEEFKGENQNNQ